MPGVARTSTPRSRVSCRSARSSASSSRSKSSSGVQLVGHTTIGGRVEPSCASLATRSHNAAAIGGRRTRERVARPIVDDRGLHAVFARQPIRERLRHGEVRVARASPTAARCARCAFTARCRSPTFTAAMVCERLCQSITNRAPRRRDASHAMNKRRKRRRVLDEDQCPASGCASATRTAAAPGRRRAPPSRRRTGGRRLSRGPRNARSGRRWHVNARVRRDRRHHRRAFEADQVDVAAGRGQRRRVILHARAAAQISDYDNGGSH